MKELTVRKAIMLNADSEKVWDALVNPEMTKQYMFGCEVISEWKVGSPIIWKGFSKGTEKIFIKGSIKKIKPGKLLQYTAGSPGGRKNTPRSKNIIATYELISGKGQTLLSVTQGNYAKVKNGEKKYSETEEYLDNALDGLKALVEEKH